MDGTEIVGGTPVAVQVMIPQRKKNNAYYRLWRVIPGQDELEKLKTK